MDLQEFKKEYIRSELGVTEKFGRIFSFIDFGNVNKWFDKDNQDWDFNQIANNEKIAIDVQKLKDFAWLFSEKVRIYYGKDPFSTGSKKFIYYLRKRFGKRNVITKHIQRIKHYLKNKENEENINENFIQKDKDGKNFVEIRKCNFDVEISVDALKLLNYYDTFCLFSSDADFAYLNKFLKSRGKKIILIKSGEILHTLRDSVDLIVNAQQIKRYIAFIKKQEPGEGRVLVDSVPE